MTLSERSYLARLEAEILHQQSVIASQAATIVELQTHIKAIALEEIQTVRASLQQPSVH